MRGRRASGPLALLFGLLLLAAGTAQAQTEVTLVSNTGQFTTQTRFIGQDRAQAFTTGAASDGYNLTRVEIPVEALSTSELNTVTVRIESSNASNRPGGNLGTLTNGNRVSGRIQFTTSPIHLAANTTYFVVWESTASHNSGPQYDATTYDGEDSGGAQGWSIDNGSLYRDSSDEAWKTSSAQSLKLAHPRPRRWTRHRRSRGRRRCKAPR